MALYTTENDVRRRMGSDLVTALQDFDQDGTADTVAAVDAITDLIADVSGDIDAELGEKYEVPFPATTDTPATPVQIQTLAKHMVIERLLQPRAAFTEQHATFKAIGSERLVMFREGTLTVPDGTRVSASGGHSGFHFDDVEAAEPVYSGLDDDDADRFGNF